MNILKNIYRIMLGIMDIINFPCLLFALYLIMIETRIGMGGEFDIARAMVGLALPVVYLRIFYVPYILLFVTICLYTISLILDRKNSVKMIRFEITLDIVLWLICILEFIFMEPLFRATMAI